MQRGGNDKTKQIGMDDTGDKFSVDDVQKTPSTEWVVDIGDRTLPNHPAITEVMSLVAPSSFR